MKQNTDEAAIESALETLAGVDTYDINLRDHSKAWAALEKLGEYFYAEGRRHQRTDDALALEAAATKMRIGL